MNATTNQIEIGSKVTILVMNDLRGRTSRNCYRQVGKVMNMRATEYGYEMVGVYLPDPEGRPCKGELLYFRHDDLEARN